MPQGRHRLEKQPRTRPHLAAVAAPIATVAVVGAGVGVSGLTAQAGPAPVTRPAGADLLASTARSVSTSAAAATARSIAVSRDLDRVAPRVESHKWATADLNLYAKPSDDARVVGEIRSARKVALTGHTRGDFSEVVLGRTSRWVHTGYLADEKPVDPASQGLVFQPCAASAAVEHGLVPGAVRAWEAVCNAFPQVATYGGLANRPEHNTGNAIDAMVYGDSALGYKIAEFLKAHAAELDLYDIIYRQHIWTPVRAGEGWRLMPDRGSATANHMDHVHFAVN